MPTTAPSRTSLLAQLKSLLLPVSVFESSESLVEAVVDQITETIRTNNSADLPTVLVLPTGSTPVSVYKRLAEISRTTQLDFSKVWLVQLDEYIGIPNDALQSYARFIREYLIEEIAGLSENRFLSLQSDTTIEGAGKQCKALESKLAGIAPKGVDLCLLGLGPNGHIGCNEPDSDNRLRTAVTPIAEITRATAANEFYDAEKVPTHWFGLGLRTILDAKKVILMADGEKKASILAEVLRQEAFRSKLPATALCWHPDAEVFCGVAAAIELDAFAKPHACEEAPSSLLDWSKPVNVRRTVVSLALQHKLGIGALTREHYQQTGLDSLLQRYSNAGRPNASVLDDFRRKLVTNPGEFFYPGIKAEEAPNTAVYSPHPDDDVIAMAGIIRKLTEKGYPVHIVYGTAGAIAVRHETLLAVIGDEKLLKEACAQSDISDVDSQKIAQAVREDLQKWDRFHDAYSKETRFLSSMIRRAEARKAAQSCGVPAENIHFLDLSFYDSGRVKKRPLSEEDVAKTLDLVRKIASGVDIAAGDISDPNGTHRVVLEASRRAWEIYDAERQDAGLPQRQTWLYRVAWAKWAIHNIDVAVPLTLDETEAAISASRHHESQIPLRFSGGDPLTILERAQQVRTRQARLLVKLGVCDADSVFGVETLVRWDCRTELSTIF